MKYQNSLFLFFSLILCFNQAILAAETKEPNWSKIYSTEINKSRSDLSLQCALKSDDEYKAFLKKQTDPDLKLSSDQFNKALQKMGIMAPFSNVNSADFETKKVCYLNSSEYSAIQIYTGSYYGIINSALRTLDLKELKTHRLLIKFMLSGLSKLENYQGYVKRGTSLSESRLSHCKPGAVFADRGFLSTSIASGFHGEYKFVIQSKTCKYIAPFSIFQGEEEVLCLPGTVFQIRYLPTKEGYSDKKILVEEVAQSFDIDDLIKVLTANPGLQHPEDKELLGQSCQPLPVVDAEK